MKYIILQNKELLFKDSINGWLKTLKKTNPHPSVAPLYLFHCNKKKKMEYKLLYFDAKAGKQMS